LANDSVISLKELAPMIQVPFPELNEARLEEIVRELQSEYLLYADTACNAIISIVDTDGAPTIA
jgi:hypothetical protein